MLVTTILEDKITLPLGQKVVGPFAVMVGVLTGVTFTKIVFEALLIQPLASVIRTLKLPEVVAVKLALVAPDISVVELYH